MDKMKKEDFENESKGFFNFYKKKIGESIRESDNVVFINFNELSSFSHKLSDFLLENPEEAITKLEISLEEMGLVKNPRIRFYDLSENVSVKIRNIRARHLGKFIWIEGIVRQASDVRPQVVSAKFECPSCGAIISVLQLEKKFKEPSRCSCGRKGFFKLVAKDMVDAQRLVLEESPESLIGGEQPRRLNVFLKEDLVEPKMEERTTPGSKVRVLGVLNEVPVPLQTGAISTRFDLAVDANNLIPLEETYTELKISEEDELQIKELSMDPNIFKKLADNIAPSIFGYEEIKQAIVLQLFGGVKKIRGDGTSSRGDVHILLVGDPGVAKSIGKNEKILFYDGKDYGYYPVSQLYNKFGKYPKNLKTLTIDAKNHKPLWCSVNEIIKHLPENDLIEITTEHGKSILATKDHSFITLDSEGNIVSIKGDKLDENNYLPIPINFHNELLSEINVDKFNTFNTNSKQLPKKIKLDELFGFFIGIFLSEGYIRNEKVVSISNKNIKIKKKVKDFAKKIGFEASENEKEILINSKSLCNLLKEYCYNSDKLEFKNRKGNYSRIKKIPDFAFFSKRDFVKGVISGLFSGDGRLIKDKKRLKGFELISVSKELAQGTSDLLFSIGVMNRIIKRNYTYKNNLTNYYILSVSTPMISKFIKNFNIYGRQLPNFEKPIYSYHDCIPCGDLVYDLTKQLGFNSRLKGDRVFAAEMRTIKKRNQIGRLRLRSILKKFQNKIKGKNKEFEILKKIAYSPIIWSKIKNIENIKKKKEDVYDLSIPGTNTFVSNGLGVHNSVTLGFIAKMAPKGRYVVGKSASGAGLCVSPDSLVLTNPGGMESIESIVESRIDNEGEYRPGVWKKDNIQDIKIQSLSNNLKLQSKFPESIWRLNSPEKLYEIILSSGKKIKLTANTQLLSIDNGNLIWEKSNKLKTGDYIATPRKLVSGNIEKVNCLDLISSNPVVHNVKPFVKEIVKKLEKKDGSIRKSAERLGISEGNLYYNWVNENARGNIKLNDLKKISNDINIDYRNFVSEVSLYNGKKHKIPKLLSKDLIYIAGLIAGDGDIRKSDTNTLSIRLSNNNDKIHSIFRNTLENEFGLKGDVQKASATRPESSRFNSRIAGEIFLSLGIPLSPKSNKIILSNNLLHLSNELLSEFLAGLYDSDGSICLRNTKGSDCIDFTTCSEKLAKQLQLVLLRFEIHSTLRKREPSKGLIKGNYPKWILEIRGIEQIKRFSSFIKLRHSDKKRKLDEIVNKNKSTNTNIDIIPNISNLLKEELLNQNISLKKISWHENISRDYGIKIVNLLKDNEKVRELKKIILSDIFWERIKSIKEIDSESDYVYDLTVNDSHNFVVDGVLVHNTATVVRDEFLKGWSLEAGAMVLSHKGILCIDEIEKMDPQDRSSMHEALEQQTVTISKANVQATLRAETSVLAAGNPKFGRFDPYMPIAQQVDIQPTLLNRFDVIFMLRDLPNKDKDDAIASHMLKEHQTSATKGNIDSELFRKYVAFAKQKIVPSLSDEAVDEIKKFYVTLRNAPSAEESAVRPIPITARQIGAMVRLAEASAKTRLSEVVEKKDAEIAINILKYYLMQAGYDYETKSFDIDKITSGITASKRGKIIDVKNAIITLQDKVGKQIPLEELENSLEGKVSKQDLDEAIEKLSISGDIFVPRKGYIQLV